MSKKKIEWSKVFTLIIAIIFAVYGIFCGVKYYNLCEQAIENGNGSYPDATLAVTCVTTVLGSLLSYLLYNGAMKNSRNKYGIDSNGQPFQQTDCPLPEDGPMG